jgi:copper transport protein
MPVSGAAGRLPPLRPRAVLRHLAGCLLLVLALGGPPREAAAHAALVESAPADGSALAASPQEIRLVFNEPVAPVAVKLLDASGAAVAGLPVDAVDRTVILRLGETLPAGTYIVSYRVTSADSHAVAGSILFAVGSTVAIPRKAKSAAATGWRIAVALNRFLWIALSLTAAGLAMFLLLCGTTIEAEKVLQLERRLRLAALSALPLGLLAIGLAGGLLLDGSALGLLDSETWRVGGTTTLARSMAAASAGLAISALASWLRASRAGAALRVAGVLLVAGSFGLTGHAATVEPAIAMGPAVAIHAGLAAFWWGSLLGLAVVLRESTPDAAAPAVRRFSRAAAIFVGGLLALGIAIGLVQLRRLSALVDPGYGLALCGKLLLVGVLLAIAACNKLRFMPRLADGDVVALRTLRRSVRVETALVLLVFGATAALGQLPPPRTQAAANAAVSAEAVSSRGSRAIVEISPGRAGRNEIVLQLTDAAGRPLAAQEVGVAVSLPSAGIGPIRRRLHEVAPGRYHLPELTLPLAGRWTLRIEALVSDFDKQDFTLEAEIR